MKILYIITKSELGGAQTHLLEVVRYMHRAGHSVLVVAGTGGWLTDELAATGIKYMVLPSLVREINPVKDVKTIKLLCNIVGKEQPDIIHCHSSKAGILGRVVGWIQHVPVVFTAHGWAFTSGVSVSKRIFYAAIEYLMLGITNKVICVSEYDRNLAAKWFLHRYAKIVTVHNGIADKKCEIHACNAVASCLKLVSVARFSQQKNNMDLIRAVEQVNSVHANGVQLNMVGDGPLLPECQAYVSAHHLGDVVHFLGSRTDVESVLAQNDIFCLISNYEGLPISIIEAMRAGMPVIASDVGGVNELIQDGLNGYLIPRGNLSELAEKLEYMLQHRENIESMGIAGRKIYEKEYTADRMNQKILSVYDGILRR